MNIAQFSLQNKKVIYFFLVLLLVGGVLAFGKLGKKEDSPFVIKQVVLITKYPGATPQEIEELVTLPIEREVQTLRRIYKIKSESTFGMSKIQIELNPETPPEEIPQMWDELRRKVLNIEPQLPQGTSKISVNDDFGDVFGIYFGLYAYDGFSDTELRDWAQKLKTELSVVDGVMKVALFGEQQQVVNVSISMTKLANMGISPQKIMNVLQAQNQIISTGDKQAGEMQVKVVAEGTYKTIQDIRNQMIITDNGSQINLGEIATIEKATIDPPYNIIRVNGHRAIGIGVSTDPTRDVVKTGELVRERLEEITPLMPIGLELASLYPEDVIAREANNGFIINLIESILIVIVIIMLVMGLRAGLLIGSSLIFSIGGTLLIMQFIDVGLNRTSLAGFIIAMGMLVDNAIVVTDNAQISMQRGIKRRKALIDGATIPQWGLLGATLIAVFSFLPLYLAPSSVAEIVKPLFIVLAISLGLSWILALTQTPVFGEFILKEPKGGDEKDPYSGKFYQGFEKILVSLIKRRWTTIIGIVATFILSLMVMGMMPSNFFPNLDKPYFRADVYLPDGYSIKEMDRRVKQIEEKWGNHPGVKQLSVTIGSSPLRYYLASTAVGPKDNFANFLIELHSSDSTAYYEEQFYQEVNAMFPDVIVRSSLFKLSPATEASIEIGFLGPNIDTLTALTNRAMEIMKHDPKLINVRNNWGNQIPALLPSYSQEKGQRLGVTRQSVSQSIRLATNGLSIGEYREGDLFMPIMLKDENIDSFDFSNMLSLPVFTPSGRSVILGQVVDSIPFDYEYGMIRHFNRVRLMCVQGDPARGENTNATFTRVWKQMQETMVLPEGYQMKYFGEQESQDDSNEALAANMPLTFILIFITLLLLFRTYRKPTIILAMIPMIFIGVVLGLMSLGKNFDFFSVLGLLGLVGMNIKNAIVLVDQIGIELEEGKSQLDAVVSATKSRLVPVSMASGTTILGMLPLLFDSMFGGMAATIMGGLLVASILTLFILPVVYCVAFKVKA